jgi:hypothetical protein
MQYCIIVSEILIFFRVLKNAYILEVEELSILCDFSNIAFSPQ